MVGRIVTSIFIGSVFQKGYRLSPKCKYCTNLHDFSEKVKQKVQQNKNFDNETLQLHSQINEAWFLYLLYEVTFETSQFGVLLQLSPL